MIKLMILLNAFAHWQACLWGLSASYMKTAGEPNWISAFEKLHEDEYGVRPTGLEIYVAALYWSVMTLSA